MYTEQLEKFLLFASSLSPATFFLLFLAHLRVLIPSISRSSARDAWDEDAHGLGA